jgi:hypothetical protein
MSPQVLSEIEIQATAERVWDVLTDFAAYPTWNPFIPRLDGRVEVDTRLEARLKPPGGRGMDLHPNVIAATPAQELRWLGHLIVPGLFDGEHGFRIESMGPDRVRFVQEERFTGLLAPILWRFIGSATRQGFEEMNLALKARAELPAATSR